jgi:bifunctional DNase/RNase
MKVFCDSCGINFYFRPSIPNSRVKAAAIKDKEGRVFLFISDLFKCIENLWISFVHECVHILKNDFSSDRLIVEDNIGNYENYIDEQAMKFFTGDFFTLKSDVKPSEIVLYAKRKETPIGIVAEIYRYITKKYNDKSLNIYIHYYKSEDLRWSSPF